MGDEKILKEYILVDVWRTAIFRPILQEINNKSEKNTVISRSEVVAEQQNKESAYRNECKTEGDRVEMEEENVASIQA